MLANIVEGWIMGGLLGALMIYYGARLPGKRDTKRWSTVSAVLILSWAVLLITETFWWFWSSETVHRVIMFAGGSFGLFWSILYFVLRKK